MCMLVCVCVCVWGGGAIDVRGVAFNATLYYCSSESLVCYERGFLEHPQPQLGCVTSPA